MAFGIAAPLPYEAIGHGLLFVDIAIAMYDLDKFKRINDMYGHSAGDEALVAVSEAVRFRLCEDETGNRVVMYCSEMDSADNGYCGYIR